MEGTSGGEGNGEIVVTTRTLCKKEIEDTVRLEDEKIGDRDNVRVRENGSTIYNPTKFFVRKKRRRP